MQQQNHIYITLNETYYNTLENEWKNIITDSTWQVGGMDGTGTAKETYEIEVGAKQSGYVETMKIGLMYASDYGYGVSPEKWTTSLGEYLSEYGADNWLYLGDYEWTISRSANSSIYMGFAFTVKFDYGGAVYIYQGSFNDANVVRPSFYLESSVGISGGTSTESDPFRLNFTS